jgi:hypothetical protein
MGQAQRFGPRIQRDDHTDKPALRHR